MLLRTKTFVVIAYISCFTRWLLPLKPHVAPPVLGVLVRLGIVKSVC